MLAPPSLAPDHDLGAYDVRGAPMKVVCVECMKMFSLGRKNSVVKVLINKIPVLLPEP